MEIGSEFWLNSQYIECSDTQQDDLYVLAGRTAVDIIIQDISSERNIRSVYMPAYCCESMIAPFLNRGIDVKLYDVDFKYNKDEDTIEIKTDSIDVNCDADIFYVTNYFGYNNNISETIIKYFSSKGSIILYDKTHSLFNKESSMDMLADYSFASIRKWLGVVSGAVVYKKNDTIEANLLKCPYINHRIEAMKEKGRYIAGDSLVEKLSFLEKYATFNNLLIEDYRNYEMDNLSYSIWKETDKNHIRDIRQQNASVLHNNINTTFLDELKPDIVPVFVPIFFDTKEKRDLVKKTLIDNQIYCPVHWPKNSLITPEMKVNKIFDTELSLICDQRYTEKDMYKIVSIINSIKE